MLLLVTAGGTGAETIRIEQPGGDLVRTYSPYGIMHEGTGWLIFRKDATSITLRLSSRRRGREILKSFIGKADVLIETYPCRHNGKMGPGL